MTSIEPRCLNGHPVSSTAAFCTQCGAAVTPVAIATTARPSTCANGHPAAEGAAYCTTCGAVVGLPGATSPAATPLPPWPPLTAPQFGASSPVAAAATPAGYPAAYPSPNYGAGAYAPVYAYATQGAMSGLAVASFAVSLVWLYGITSIVAIVLAVVALGRIREHHQRGRGFAVTAIVLGVLGLLGGIGAIAALASGGS